MVLWPSRPTAHRFVDRAPILRLKLAGSRGLASLGVGRHIGYFVACSRWLSRHPEFAPDADPVIYMSQSETRKRMSLRLWPISGLGALDHL